MKIGIIHSIYKPEVRGGAEVVVENIALGLKNQGDEVFIISVGCKNQKEEIDGLKVYSIKSFNLFNFLDINSQPAISRFFWHLLDMFNIIQAGRVYKILKKEKPALVLMHNLKGLGYLTPLVIKILKIKNIQTVHDMQLIHPSGLLPENEKIGFLANSYAGFNKLLFKSVKVVVFPSEYIKSVYQRYGFFKKAEKIVLGNPISKMPTLPEGGQAATPIGADWGGGRGEFQILFLGQVEEYKGIFDLIEAVKGLAGLPAPAGEFVLVSNKGALPELVKEGETGFVVTNNNWREKIEWCLNHQSELKDLRENCLKAAAKYNLEDYLNKLKEFAMMTKTI